MVFQWPVLRALLADPNGLAVPGARDNPANSGSFRTGLRATWEIDMSGALQITRGPASDVVLEPAEMVILRIVEVVCQVEDEGRRRRLVRGHGLAASGTRIDLGLTIELFVDAATAQLARLQEACGALTLMARTPRPLGGGRMRAAYVAA